MITRSAWSQENTITFATDAIWPPMKFFDENKNIVGFIIDYMNAAENGEGKKLMNVPKLPNTLFLHFHHLISQLFYPEGQVHHFQ
jgi:hypothetical protein